ncbi:MAG: hypothetical protein ACLFTH_02840 [Candidatus Woesearchaeota archaeon]
MEEMMLKRFAFIAAMTGFVILFLMMKLQPPEEVSGKQELPEDTTIRFNASIEEVKETNHGSSLLMQRTVREKGFIDTKVPQNLAGAEATITGKVTDGFFSIESIEVKNRFNGS